MVVDKTVINPKAHTFGEEPLLGFYEEYYKSGRSRRFDSLNSLFAERNINLTADSFNQVTKRMKRLHIGDITKDQEYGIVIYSWGMSAMWGANGVVYSPTESIPEAARRNFDQIERLSAHFFAWTVE